MKALVQRVLHASVKVNQQLVSEIGPGLLVLLGVARGDSEADAVFLANKIAGLRVFEDTPGKMNLDVKAVNGEVLTVPQFTLLGECSRGLRPDFTQAAPPEEARQLFARFCGELEKRQVITKPGSFREHMQVQLLNDGPVTLMLDSRGTERKHETNH